MMTNINNVAKRNAFGKWQNRLQRLKISFKKASIISSDNAIKKRIFISTR